MAFYIVLAGGIVMGVGAITAGVSCAITGIQSTKLPPEQDGNRQTLVASSALVGFGTICLIIALAIIWLRGTAKRKGGAYISRGPPAAQEKFKKKLRNMLIGFIVFLVLYIMLVAIGAGLAVAVAQKEESAQYKDALMTAAYLTIASLGLFIIGYIIFSIGMRMLIR